MKSIKRKQQGFKLIIIYKRERGGGGVRGGGVGEEAKVGKALEKLLVGLTWKDREMGKQWNTLRELSNAKAAWRRTEENQSF